MDDSERIARLLLELKMDAETLGKSIGKNDGDTIRNVLKGKNNLSAKLASAIAKKHNINYVWLMTGEGEIIKAEKDKGQGSPDSSGFSLGDKDFVIKQQQELITSQRGLIEKLLAQIEKLQIHD